MYIKATIQSSTGRFRASGFLTADGTIAYGIEFNSPHTVHWQYTNPIELNITTARRRTTAQQCTTQGAGG